MRYNQLKVIFVVALLPACILRADNAPPSTNGWTLELSKEDAAEAMASDPNAPDYCDERGWYRDGICDRFCRAPDPDCVACIELGTCALTCTSDAGCPQETHCKKDPGTCVAREHIGSCEPLPSSDCPTIDAPVCGCDGQTYSNLCVAQSQGANVARQGACELTECSPSDCAESLPSPLDLCADGSYQPTACELSSAGTCELTALACPTVSCTASSPGSCAAEFYCALPSEGACYSEDVSGTCAPLPGGCDDVVEPVCGCDDVTYSNACEAHIRLAQIAYEGECEGADPGECKSSHDCDADQVCELAPGSCGEDNIGRCVERPEDCAALYEPVCGCDQRTYATACAALQRGVAIDHDGECDRPVEPGCSGRPGEECPEDLFCRYAQRTCLTPGARGECAERPRDCGDEEEPVCGCDGVTYASVCHANQEGISVAYVGSCDP